MEYHLERRIRLVTNQENKNSWVLNEVDELGFVIGHDQLPWEWTLYFTASACVLNENIEIGSKLDPIEIRVARDQTIRAQLHPAADSRFGRTNYSMFGTDRPTEKFELYIHPLEKPEQVEECRAWGSVSYSAEFDFETTEDCVVFRLFVSPRTFDDYVSRILQGQIDDLTFSVGSVSGFYSQWSPLISTANVKILTEGEAQKVMVAADSNVDPPRLGKIGQAKLYINRRLAMEKPSVECEPIKEHLHAESESASEANQTSIDPRLFEILLVVKRIAWSAVLLLALIFFTILIK